MVDIRVWLASSPLFWDRRGNSRPYLHALPFADRFRQLDRREPPRPCRLRYRQARLRRDTLVGHKPDRSERSVVCGRAPQRQIAAGIVYEDRWALAPKYDARLPQVWPGAEP